MMVSSNWTSPSPAIRVSVQTGLCGSPVASTATPENSSGSVVGLAEVATMLCNSSSAS
eukprot:CAMPEP_0172902618 /NCGR_PEP_ID=MMETSP1075-20121228/168791_1 /TAXON_ID=2916 /ORGANISM="Ceratium fusus, Strain PA161109" /LENGTH=57 /DNA_ID=CAMNT_0013759249 /DNA_START=43 /DNA_END=212 /DNA_ORIENTATION=-